MLGQMPEPTAAATICDLLGDDPWAAPPAPRPPLRRAVRGCAPGQVVPARHRGADMAVFVLADGRAFAAPDRCPHDGGLLSDGFVNGDRLVCARHGWEFEAPSGRCPLREACVPLRAIGRKPGRKR